MYNYLLGLRYIVLILKKYSLDYTEFVIVQLPLKLKLSKSCTQRSWRRTAALVSSIFPQVGLPSQF